MAEEEDFSQLPLVDQFTHKNWKARKGGYEAAAKQFDTAVTEDDPIVRQFLSDAGIWKGVVGDSNVAAQQEGLGAYISFLNIAGHSGCIRSVPWVATAHTTRLWLIFSRLTERETPR